MLLEGCSRKLIVFFFNPCKVAGLALECERNQILIIIFTYLDQVCKTIQKASKLFKLPHDFSVMVFSGYMCGIIVASF